MPRTLPKGLRSLMSGERQFETKGFEIGGPVCIGMRFRMGKAQFLVVKGRKGYLSSDALDLSKAEEAGDAAAVVGAASSFDELFQKKVVALTRKAERLGVRKGMGGREALALLNS